ncbi:hypothetical protein DICPUDRAFT_26158 [Dictyostelium purpureum]|uniref:Protein arginine methyltransferase NDUFAF7 n=1 Tax=Dictyostelium purpureum TaxID=5786 RepID=F0Z879_DICPU|nr:uncharacterized protein DICPUDRAFT_26158 [Dictyostelium purpureum]EGC39880.1 hypothetical protein DICPUDRAFT_26158 [Dictyostelium purpureum]|eukprot:XP_003283631.1 hypothetical protein DICPUDRAFT_26158 [Dictyostelium purpureum]
MIKTNKIFNNYLKNNYLNILNYSKNTNNHPNYKTLNKIKELNKKKLQHQQQQEKEQEQNQSLVNKDEVFKNFYDILKDNDNNTTLNNSNDDINNINNINNNTKNNNVKNSLKLKTQIMRDFIQDSLYNQDYGYFQTKEVIISPNIKIPPLNSLKNFREYNNYLHYIYKSLEHAWLTPVELYKPYYSWSIANYIIDKHNNREDKSKNLKIYEIGAGSGTNALNILNFMRSNHLEIYKTMEYKIIEISKPLALKQFNRIKADHPALNIQINNTSIFNWTHKTEEDECFIILTEVIDNLPHDKIVLSSNGIFESTVCSTVFETFEKSKSILSNHKSSGYYREETRQLTDPIIKEYLEYEEHIKKSSSFFPRIPMLVSIKEFYQKYLKSFFKDDEERYLPTVCFKLFQIFSIYFPKHHIVLADFDELPSLVKGENAPTVQKKIPITTGDINNPYHVPGSNPRGYESIDMEEILTEPGSCDIFFPYDWKNLKQMYCYTNRDRLANNFEQVKTYKHKEFLKKYGKDYLNETKTKSGYNPMIRDYGNMSFLLS